NPGRTQEDRRQLAPGARIAAEYGDRDGHGPHPRQALRLPAPGEEGRRLLALQRDGADREPAGPLMAPPSDFPLAFEGGCTPLLLALFDQTPVVDGARLAIHAADDMMNHFLWNYGEGRGWQMEQALSAYFRSGLMIWEHQRRILEWRFGDLATCKSVLDFASGYGRATRFMIHDLGGERVWAAEIDPDAVRFQQEVLGAHGLLSTPVPGDSTRSSSLPFSPTCPRRRSAVGSRASGRSWRPAECSRSASMASISCRPVPRFRNPASISSARARAACSTPTSTEAPG